MKLKFQEKHLFLCRLPKTLQAQDLSKLRLDIDRKRGRWSTINVSNVNGEVWKLLKFIIELICLGQFEKN